MTIKPQPAEVHVSEQAKEYVKQLLVPQFVNFVRAYKLSDAPCRRWFQSRPLDFYVRIELKEFAKSMGFCLTIANLEVNKQYQGIGIASWLLWVLPEYHPFRTTYIENASDDTSRIARRLGYSEVVPEAPLIRLISALSDTRQQPSSFVKRKPLPSPMSEELVGIVP